MFESWCDGSFTVSPSSSDPLLTSTVGDMSDSASSSLSVSSSPVEEPRTILSISTTFYPGAPETENSDLVLSSSDGVFFFVHRSRLLEGSSNSFGGLVPPIKETKKVVETVVSPLSEGPLAEDISINDPTIDLNSILAVDDAEFSAPPDDPASTIIPVAESASILNMVLLIVYRLPMERYHPDLQLMCTAMPALVSFGYQPADFVTPTSETFRLFMAHSLTHPLVVYALAASYKLERLAVACSQNTLGVELSQISDDLATVMGPVYLRRLFFLHLGRTDALKRLLLEPPTGHLPLPNCDVENQKALTRAWALAAAYMAVEGRPNTHTSMLSMSLEALGEHLACQKCRACLSERIQSVVQQWSAVSVTI